MPPESVVDQALLLKKRARRRLVGAIAMVIVMLIILPNVLKDQTVIQDRAPIKLTMPEAVENEVVVQEEAVASAENSEPVISTETLPENIIPENNPTASAPIKAEEPKPTPAPQQAIVVKQEEKKSITNSATSEAKQKEKQRIAEQNNTKKINRPAATKTEEAKPTGAKPQRFLIQIGVYSDEANVKQLQAKISEAGFTSRTAKLQTPKGEKIRLRVGSFVTREAAAEALKKIQASGLTGMVLIDE